MATIPEKMSSAVIAGYVKAGQQRKKEEEIKNAGEWYHKFHNELSKRLELNLSAKNPKIIPFGYQSWQNLCEDIEKWGTETLNTYKNVCLPGSVKKPVFYKFNQSENKPTEAIYIRIHNAGTPSIMVIEFAITASQDVTDSVTELLQLGSNRRLQYLYSQSQENKKIKTRLCKQPTLDLLKIRLLRLFKAGYGVSFRE